MAYSDDANEDEIRNIVRRFAGGGYTLEKPQTKAQFLEKYKDALDSQGRFIPGKANLEYDDMNASDLYDYLMNDSPMYDADGNVVGTTGPRAEINADWIEDPRAKGWIAQHPAGAAIIGTVLGGVGANALGLLGSSGAGAAAAATGTPASGVAGTLGLSKGIGATALNSGVNSALINAGTQLATTGKLDIEKALTAGVKSGVTGGLGDWASSTVTDYLPTDWTPNAIDAVGAGTKGAVVAGLTGQDPLLGAAGAGLGSYAGDTVKDYLGKGQYTPNIASAVNAGVNTAVKGGDVGKVLSAAGASMAAIELANKIPGYASYPAEVQKAIRAGLASSIQGKNPTAAVLSSALSSAMDYSQNVLFPKKTGGKSGTTPSASPANATTPLTDAGVREYSQEDLEQLAVGLPFLDGQTDLPTVYTVGDGRTDVDVTPLSEDDLKFLDMPGYYEPPTLGTVTVTGQREPETTDTGGENTLPPVTISAPREGNNDLGQVTVTGPKPGLTEVIDPADLIPPPMPPIPPIKTTPTTPGGKSPSITLPTGGSTPSSSSGGAGATMYTAPVEGAKIRLMDFDNYSLDDIADIINGSKQQKQPIAQTLFAAEGGSIDDLLAYLRS